jgi:uncharacterized protein
MLPAASSNGTVLVTGASSGIGEELAREFARRGRHVLLVARRADKLEALAASLGSAADVLAADLSHAVERAALPERVAELGLVVDVLVNNAGLSTSGPVFGSDPVAELNLVEVDVAAVADLCSRFLPGMVSRGRGAVLNVASVGGFGPLPGQAAYGAAKAFVLSYTQAIGEELRGTGVTAAALCPGRSAPTSARRQVFPTRTPKPRCPKPCGSTPTSSPRLPSTGWPQARRSSCPVCSTGSAPWHISTCRADYCFPSCPAATRR